jgi:hypothetical protein
MFTKLKIISALVAAIVLPMAGSAAADPVVPKSGTTPYTTHFVFVPKSVVDISGVGKAVALEGTGPTENTAGEKFLDKMTAKCAAISIEAAGKKWIDGGCALTDSDGDVIFSTFDTRELDKSQPKMDCGTHTIIGGTGKYKGISGTEPSACISKPAPAGSPEGAVAIDVPHITTWEIKG